MEETLNKLLEEYRNNGNTISLLQEIQESFGYIPEDAVNWFSKKLDIPASKFFGIITFYSQFHLKPRGKNIITACCGTACHVKGAEKIIDKLRKELKLPDGEVTTGDNEFTLEKVNCVGACSIAPVVLVNKKVVGKASSDIMIKEIKAIKDKTHVAK